VQDPILMLTPRSGRANWLPWKLLRKFDWDTAFG
jgi:hypothetical protein